MMFMDHVFFLSHMYLDELLCARTPSRYWGIAVDKAVTMYIHTHYTDDYYK